MDHRFRSGDDVGRSFSIRSAIRIYQPACAPNAGDAGKSGDLTGVDWWIHQRPRPEMRKAIARLERHRFICTPCVSKHRLFVWVPSLRCRITLSLQSHVTMITHSVYYTLAFTNFGPAEWGHSSGKPKVVSGKLRLRPSKHFLFPTQLPSKRKRLL